MPWYTSTLEKLSFKNQLIFEFEFAHSITLYTTLAHTSLPHTATESLTLL